MPIKTTICKVFTPSSEFREKEKGLIHNKTLSNGDEIVIRVDCVNPVFTEEHKRFIEGVIGRIIMDYLNSGLIISWSESPK